MPTSTLPVIYRRAWRRSPEPARPVGALRHFLARLRCWRDNHTDRHRLMNCLRLDPRFAKDIGLSPSEIETICGAPFWREMPPIMPG